MKYKPARLKAREKRKEKRRRAALTPEEKDRDLLDQLRALGLPIDEV